MRKTAAARTPAAAAAKVTAAAAAASAVSAAAAADFSQWGRAREMNALESVMWRVEADPHFRSTLLLVEMLDRVPEWQRMRDAHDWVTRMVPRFRQRVVEPLLALGAPRWATDPHFDLDYHLRRSKLPGAGTMRELLELAQGMAMAPFDRARPLWESMLVEGVEGGRAAFLLKIHHAVTDGVGGIQLLGAMHSRRREHDPDRPEPAPPPPEAITPAGAAAEALLGRARQAPQGLARAYVAAGQALRHVAQDPKKRSAELAAAALSITRMLAPPAPSSPLLAGRSLSYRYLTHEFPLDTFKRAAKAAQATVNDAYLAGIAGALGLYHQRLGAPVDELPLSIPVNLRKADDPQGGNRIGALRLAAPLAERGAAARLHEVHQRVARARRHATVDLIGIAAPLLAALPLPLLVRSYAEMTRHNDVQASNVPGLTEPRYFAGAEVTHMFPFGPLPGCAAMFGIVTHNGICCLGVNVDPAAVTDLAAFAECLRAGFDEVLALADAPAAPAGRAARAPAQPPARPSTRPSNPPDRKVQPRKPSR